MHEAIEALMREHRLIEEVLGALETFADAVGQGEAGGRGTVADFGAFFKNFADRCHHGKEEDRLFATMVKHGFPGEFGPIAMMLAEHGEGRQHVAALVAMGEGSGPLSDEEKQSLIAHAEAYVPLLRAHILKEDNILYPMAQQSLPAEVMQGLAGEFERFEEEVMGQGTHQSFRALAESLVDAYPPRSGASAAGAACFTCPGHM
jgi:hemerythrin-like domain-containing protein